MLLFPSVTVAVASVALGPLSCVGSKLLCAMVVPEALSSSVYWVPALCQALR